MPIELLSKAGANEKVGHSLNEMDVEQGIKICAVSLKVGHLVTLSVVHRSLSQLQYSGTLIIDRAQGGINPHLKILKVPKKNQS